MIQCPSCHNKNPDTAKFCSACGHSLLLACNNCGYKNPLSSKFCSNCGNKLHETTVKETDEYYPERRQITAMFCDLVGSTDLSEKLELEDFIELVETYQKICKKTIIKYGGEVNQLSGDGVVTFFGFPIAHENDARRSVQSALGILEAIKEESDKRIVNDKEPMTVRIGIHSGIVVGGKISGKDQVLGKTPNLAARLEGVAENNSIAISKDTLKLVRGFFEVESMGEFELKGIHDNIEVFKVIRALDRKNRLDVYEKHEFTPFVGREQELELILKRFKNIKANGGSCMIVRGEAGIGKSRLIKQVKESITEISDVSVLEIQTSSFSQSSPYLSLIDTIRATFINDDQLRESANDTQYLKSLLRRINLDNDEYLTAIYALLSIPTPTDFGKVELSSVKRKQLTMNIFSQMFLHLSENNPLLILMEDLHWADFSTQEWLEGFIESVPTSDLLLVITTRPMEEYPSWMNKSFIGQVSLNALTPESVRAICMHKSQGKSLPDFLLSDIIKKTDGIPLFAEELTSDILESGVLVEEETTYRLRSKTKKIEIPASLLESLTSRLDRLEKGKEIVQAGSVIGRTFTYRELQLLAELQPKELQDVLSYLVRQEILFQKGLEAEKSFYFKHALIQDAAYNSLVVEKKQALHMRVAEVIAELDANASSSQPELLAQHYTEANLFEEAIPLWLKAGQMASQKHAIKEAITHLEKGLKLLEHLDDSEEKDDIELDYLLSLGGAYVVYYGYTSKQVGDIFNLAKTKAQKVKTTPKLAFILYNLQTYYLLCTQFETTSELIEYGLEIGKNKEIGYLFKLFSLHIKGVLKTLVGDFLEAKYYLEETINYFDPNIEIPYEFTPGGNVKINAESWLMLCLDILGDREHSKKIALNHYNERLKQTDSRTLYHIYAWISWSNVISNEWESAVEIMEEYHPILEKFGDLFFELISNCTYYIAASHLNQEGAFIKANEKYTTIVNAGASPTMSCFICELHLLKKDYKNCLGLLEENIQFAERAGLHMNTAELYRIKANLFKAQHASNEEIENIYQKAIKVAKEQKAKLFELRTSHDLAGFWIEQNRKDEALDLIQNIYGQLENRNEAVDMQKAKKLIEKLNK